jgi:hypothetical protein
MKIILAGGSGQVGAILGRAFAGDEYELVVLSRNDTDSRKVPRHVHWDAKTVGTWATLLDGADVLINLAGRNVNCRYNARNRRAIMESRVDSTRALGQAIQSVDRPPKAWLQSSTATIYRHTFAEPHDEVSGQLGGDEPDVPRKWDFSVEVAKAWELAALQFDLPNTRLVLMRSALVLSPDKGGIFDTLRRIAALGLGGRAASGEQYISWLHEVDFVRAIRFLIDHQELSGPVNLAAPNPLPYIEFMRALRAKMGVPIGMPATKWMLEIAAFFLRTETELILKSRRVIPGRLQEAGFEFQYPIWPEAAQELVRRNP